MDDLVQKHKDYLTRCIRGYDNSLKIKGLSLFSILQSIDSNTSITDEEIRQKYSLFYNKTVLTLRRENKPSKIAWLNSNSATILKYLYVYSALSKNIYKVDDNLVDWYKRGTDDLKLLDENDLGHFIFIYNDNIYSTDIGTSDNKIGRHLSVSNVYNPEVVKDNKYISYVFDYATSPSSECSELTVVCNNSDCPRWKQSLANMYTDGAKTVACSLDDCEKCQYFKKCGVLKPKDALTVVKAIYKCMLTREYNSNSSENREDYEHIPLPQREDDVIIYFGEPKRKKSFEEIGLVPVSKMGSGIVSSHASPREHTRRGGSRREYTRKDGVKVRATTFKSTVVNKGNTKTTYKLKERK